MFSLPFQLPGFQVTHVMATETKIVVRAVAYGTTAACPSCQKPSSHVHSYYSRSPKDLPVSGKPVQLVLRVRRFRCRNPECGQRIFAERFAQAVARSAQRTTRLSSSLSHFAALVRAELGAGLLRPLGIKVSPDTLLRVAKQPSDAPLKVPQVLGVDDFAFRRGHTYGTLLIDLERRRPVDLLPDRTAETFAHWLRTHPGVKWISRDRSGEYARGASEGAPTAQQVADRWHLLKNLREVLERVLARISARLKRLEKSASVTPFPRLTREHSSTEHQASQLAREQRKARYEEVAELYRQGMPVAHIAQQLRMSRMTVYKFAAAGEFPERAPRSSSPHARRIIDPYAAYLRRRIEEGGGNAMQLYREIQEQGYAGSYKSVSRWLQAQGLVPRRYTLGQASEPLPGASPQQRWNEEVTAETDGIPVAISPVTVLPFDGPLPSPRQLAWLLVRDRASLEEQELHTLSFLRQEPLIEAAYQLAQQFIRLMQERRSDEVEAWLSVCTNCGVKELETFAQGMLRDLPAVKAAFTLSYSNGPTEGHINRLKLIKRSMYGRGSFELLRQRVLKRGDSLAA